MNRVEELIERLCPDGVEYVVLNTVCEIYDGTHNTPKYTESGIKFISVENINDLYSTKKYISKKDFQEYKIRPQKNDVIMTRIGSIGQCAVVDRDEPLAYYVSLALLRPNTTKLNCRFLKYTIESLHGRKELRKRTLTTAVPIKINKNAIGKITIPLPPLEVQNEIVKILDNFTQLEAEMEAELEARRKQYKYYLNSYFGGDYNNLLKLATDGNVKLAPLSELGTLIRGKRFVRDDIVDNGTPCIHYGDLYTYYGISATKTKSYLNPELAAKLRFAEKGDVVIVGAGENDIDIGVGVAWLGDENVAVHDACYIFKHNMNPKYVSYYLRSDAYHSQIKKYVSSGKICAISSKGIGKALIPLPPLEEQAHIVSILDRFDHLCNDLTKGLPAEIEARKKQYDYYREKLLTFKKKESETPQ